MTLPYEKSHIPIDHTVPKGIVFWDYVARNEIGSNSRLYLLRQGLVVVAAMKLKKLNPSIPTAKEPTIYRA